MAGRPMLEGATTHDLIMIACELGLVYVVVPGVPNGDWRGWVQFISTDVGTSIL